MDSESDFVIRGVSLVYTLWICLGPEPVYMTSFNLEGGNILVQCIRQQLAKFTAAVQMDKKWAHDK